MADKKAVELLPIDVDIPMPEIIPLKCEVVKKFLAEHERVLRLLETWARIHLQALTAHPRTPTKFVDNLIDEIDKEALYETKDKVFQEFHRAHINDKIEKPIGFEMTDEDLAGLEVEGEDIDGMRLLEPDRKKKRGSLFKRLLKWVPRRKTKEQEEKDPRVVEDEWHRERLLSYEELKVRFAQFLDEEVYRHKSTRASRRAARGEDVANPENLETEEGRWILDMTHRLHVCHMAFKLLGIVREKCEDVFKILAFSDLGPDVSFKGEHSNLMQGRLAYLQTTKTLALIMVHDIERMQVDNEIYAECVERFGRLHRNRELSRKDSVETKVIEEMMSKKSILPCAGSGTPEKIVENMLKSESQRHLVLDTDDDLSIVHHHSLFNASRGSSAYVISPSAAFNFRVTTPTGLPTLVLQGNALENNPAQTIKPCLFIEPKTTANSTSGYNSGVSLVSQSPADTLQDSKERPSSVPLPDSLRDLSKQEPISKEGSTSPMQTSPAEKIPSIDILKEDIDDKLKATKGKGSTSPMQTSREKIPSTDNLKEDIDDKLKATKGKGSTSPMQTSREKIPSTDNLKEDIDDKLKATKGKGSTSSMQTSLPEKIPSDVDSTDNSDVDSIDNLEGDSTDNSEDIDKKLKEGKRIGKGKRKRKGKRSKIPVETSPEKKPSDEDSTDKLNEDIEKKLKDL